VTVSRVISDPKRLRIGPMDEAILFTQQIAWVVAEKPD
jgi:hypothetical protein